MPFSGNLKFNNSWLLPPSASNNVLVAEQFNTVIGRRSYPVVTMQDGRDWLAVNLDLSWAGLSVPTSTPSVAPAGPLAVYYGFDEDTYGWYGERLGLLYNYYAVAQLEASKSTLCPGWHVPTLDEWLGLALGIRGWGGGLYTAHYLKSTTGWSSGAGNPVSPYIFDAKGAGYGYWTDNFFFGGSLSTSGYGLNTHFAASTAGSVSNSFATVKMVSDDDYLHPFFTSVGSEDLKDYKDYFSVRLIRDEAADPLNPLGLPNNTMRFEFDVGFDPSYTATWPESMTWTQVSSDPNVWDMNYPVTNWSNLFTDPYSTANKLSGSRAFMILGGNTRYVYNFDHFCPYATNLRTIAPFRLDHATNLDGMFGECTNVESGALALYQQASAFQNVPSHVNTFYNCGSGTTNGAAELAQIPTSWGGTMT